MAECDETLDSDEDIPGKENIQQSNTSGATDIAANQRADPVYAWAARLAGEQDDLNPYLWSDSLKQLLTRLEKNPYGIVIVRGLQGSGKTAARITLSQELRARNVPTFQMKWSTDYSLVNRHNSWN